jgi:hypothetical protein
MRRDLTGIIFESAMTRLAEGLSEGLEAYRETNVVKFYAEKGTLTDDYVGDYVKMERYKNRVRMVDAILPAMETFLYDLGVIKVHPDTLIKNRRQIA